MNANPFTSHSNIPSIDLVRIEVIAIEIELYDYYMEIDMEIEYH